MTTTIYNSNLTKEIIDGAKLQVGTSNIPTELGATVVPTMEVNPFLLKKCNVTKAVTATATGNSTIYTTPTDRDFYLVAATMGLVKNATNDMANGSVVITLTPKGQVAANIIAIPCLTLTAQDQNTVISFEAPLQLERGSAVTLAQPAAYAAGAMVKTASILGYTVENINA